MGVSDHYRSGMVERLLVRIFTVDPPNGRIEVVGKDSAVIQIGINQIPPLFVWPRQSEFWTVVRENGEWNLENKITGPDETLSAKPGEGVVQAEKIWTPSGDYLITKSELEARLASIEARLAALEI